MTTTQSKYADIHEGVLTLKDGVWVGIPESFFEVRGAGIQGPVRYYLNNGDVRGGKRMSWSSIRVTWGEDRADGMEVRTVVGPQDRHPGAILADVSQYRIGVLTLRYSYETPPGVPEQPFRKLYGAPEPQVKSFIGGYQPALPGASGWSEEDGDPDDDLSLEAWLEKHGDTLGESATKWEADDALTGEEALDAWLARHAASEEGDEEEEAPEQPRVSRHAKDGNGDPIWMQVLEDEGVDVSDLRKQWRETGGTWHGSLG